jgi:hypothetical protein
MQHLSVLHPAALREIIPWQWAIQLHVALPTLPIHVLGGGLEGLPEAMAHVNG